MANNINIADANDRLDTFEYYHILQEGSGNVLTDGIGPALPALGSALAGSLATAGAKAFVYPIELCITRLQVQKQLRGKGEAASAAKDAETEYASLLDAVRKIYKTEGGLGAFYTGCTSDVGKGIVDSFLFFLSYTFLRQYEKKRTGGGLSVGKELGVGIAAGSFSKFFTTPIQNIVTRQQTAALVAARDPSPSSAANKASISDIASQIHSERGLAGFWAGYSEAVILTLNPAITFAADKMLRRLLPRAQKDHPSAQWTFLVAALSKAIATTITYPAMLAKSRAQAVSPKASVAEEEGADTGGPPEMLEKSSTLNATPERRKAKSMLEKLYGLLLSQYAIFLSLRKIYRLEGLSGLYSGLEGEVLKGFIQHGLTMMMKERAHVGVIQAYYLLLKTTQRWPEEFGKAKNEAGKIAGNAQAQVAQAGEAVTEGAKKIVETATGGSKA